jgi:hypothetical protein
MKMETDHFEVDLNLHHPSCAPQVVSEAFSLEPWFSVKSGEQIGSVKHKKSSWLCHFRMGDLDSDFSNALDDIVSLLSLKDAFISEFIEGGGEIEVVLNSAVQIVGDKVFELSLHPWFLQEIGKRSIALKVSAWNVRVE